MNLRVLALLGMASGLLVLTGCPVDDPVTTGGSGGTGGEATGGTAGTGGTGGMATGGAGGAGGTGGGACSTSCADVITNDTTPCAMSNTEKLYNELAACTCGAMGKCATACKATACAMPKVTPDAECTKCVTDMTIGCGAEFGACSNDI